MRSDIFIIILISLGIAAGPEVRAATLTLDEAAVSGGDFGTAFDAPATVASDVGTVIGRQNWTEDRDYLFFDGFDAGTERLDFTFTNEGGYWGTLNLQVKYLPFTSQWEWQDLAADQYGWTNNNQDWLYSFTLPEGYTGPLYAMIRFTSGDFIWADGVDYEIEKYELTGSAAPVPLPATLPLALAGMVILGLYRRMTR